MATVHRILGSVAHFKHDLSRFWAWEWSPWVLAWILIVAVYFVAISKLSELIVGGF